MFLEHSGDIAYSPNTDLIETVSYGLFFFLNNSELMWYKVQN